MWIEETREFINSFTNFEELAIALHQLKKDYESDREHQSFRILATLDRCFEFDGGLYIKEHKRQGFFRDTEKQKDFDDPERNVYFFGLVNKDGIGGKTFVDSKKVISCEWVEPTIEDEVEIIDF